MSALESLIATSGEAPTMDSLDFSLPPANTAVVDRRQHVRAYPTSASTLTPTGTRTVRIRLGGDDFVDSSSVRIQYTINETGNVAGKKLVPFCGPWGAWSQVYLRSNGVELDNIPQYGRFHQQYGWNQLGMMEQYGEAGICGMGGSWVDGTPNTPAMGTIAVGGSYTVIHKVHVSMFNSGKYLPVRYMPLELEMTLNSTAADWLNAASGVNSTSYSISNIQLIYDAYILDEAVQESFYKALLANRALSIPTMTVYQVVQSIPAGSTTFSFAAVRAFSRLSHIWLTFRAAGARSCEFFNPTTLAGTGATPALADGGCPTARLSIGPHYWPDPQPNSSIPELFYQLQKSLPNIPNIGRDVFAAQTANTGAFTILFDVRRVPHDPTSSISTRSGDLLRVDLQNLTANLVTECWLTMFAFSVTGVRESGCTLLT
jgi:hypothetical protein